MQQQIPPGPYGPQSSGLYGPPQYMPPPPQYPQQSNPFMRQYPPRPPPVAENKSNAMIFVIIAIVVVILVVLGVVIFMVSKPASNSPPLQLPPLDSSSPPPSSSQPPPSSQPPSSQPPPSSSSGDCKSSLFGTVYNDKEPSSSFESKYKIKSLEIPAASGKPCECFNWCANSGECVGFKYTPNFTAGKDKCYFMNYKITNSDLSADRGKIYYQR